MSREKGFHLQQVSAIAISIVTREELILIIIIIIMSLFNEDNIFSKHTNLTYGPVKSKNTYQTKLYTRCLVDLNIICINMTNSLNLKEI